MSISWTLKSVTMILLSFLVSDTVSFPALCPECTDDQLAKCPKIKANETCHVVEEPNCGCCKTCAGLKGEYCGTGRPACQSDLLCLPPLSLDPVTKDGALDISQLLVGKWICTEIDDDYYGNYPGPENYPGSNNYPGPNNDYYTYEPTGDYEEDNEPEDPVVPDLEPVVSYPTDVPPESPYPNKRKPCTRHQKKVNRQKRFKIHDWLPQCNDNHMYYPYQCKTSYNDEIGRCWCVDERGNPTTHYFERQDLTPEYCSNILMRAK